MNKRTNTRIFRLAMIAVFACISLSCYSQQKTIAKFIVTDAKINGNDATPLVVSEWGLMTVFYTDNNVTYMANVCSKQDSQSYGEIYDFSNEHYDETAEQYAMDVFYFKWHYANTYDSKTGTCNIQLIKTYKPQGVATTLKMIQENLDVTEYNGYMDGTIDFSKFR